MCSMSSGIQTGQVGLQMFFHTCRVLGHPTVAYQLPRLPKWVCAAHLENAVLQASAEERAAASVAGERPQMGQNA